MHKKFLLAALEQARLGQGHCAPNPCVGAVAVQNGAIIAQACHRGAGTPHAEQLLLTQIPPKTPGVSLYISLEPCNHWGRTPPCVDAIIQHGVEEVIFAYLDPNPVVAKNNSTEKLRVHGIKVTHYPVDEINEFYKSYAYWTLTKKPRVTVKIAQTLNGKIGREVGERVILSNALCGEFTHQKRAAADVILTTAKTVRLDNPKMNVRLGQKEQQKPVAIIDRKLSLNKEYSIFSTAAHCHVYHSHNQEVSYPNSTLHFIPMVNGMMNLGAVISHLGELGYHDVWVEAGGALFSALHQEGLVHRTYLYIVPNILEHNAVSAYQQGGIFDRPHSVSWHTMGDNMVACLDWREN
ncbi:bifunctional diaminohydroxyphosphoribosylaminopyrimidine deaminase/5-amino-6-(5-phosphoribosylamino)uracil reductase RibD [Fluoribacter dumoffii]|uniref:bifunctional diaminohydroxyphosphoribosylaminopyrimidine deaminase/5-amino-6-(5-phosphoribosylamino)uracil reductase RibD n=1 Tax=Fluoribacter dumoffii TaxID=463 RepID=UPI002243AB3E|nr:bifunctional diaminohydroxyphosphoribosylaminopyrimidine deaminase/5-amino-6-(5-phosphoribosylamino)uracil reductase RibD [Fluoribacter dumoffii]MCW8385196.1 bifunctional diaminohydroxyphosphoribosylaminopyrimidine deaminase/5-amino-6-(5-phosphoribosylamino)uracil reductase RibD [Fluoribacter dumoffii]MCW8496507.1 bifunctional diaminohydroxyphosphoribosylaminopyrimidine deaminase/5-amino-6-(5-phosphoribosylamino)uracil reductase RibD [Fluoribacter dumoffii]